MIPEVRQQTTLVMPSGAKHLVAHGTTSVVDDQIFRLRTQYGDDLTTSLDT